MYVCMNKKYIKKKTKKQKINKQTRMTSFHSEMSMQIPKTERVYLKKKIGEGFFSAEMSVNQGGIVQEVHHEILSVLCQIH